MKTDDPLGHAMRDVKKAVKRVAHDAETHGADGAHINVARRTNIHVAKNVGQDDGTAFASATQQAPIVQDGTESDSEGTNRRPSSE
jgi:hypothetical protein